MSFLSCTTWYNYIAWRSRLPWENNYFSILLIGMKFYHKRWLWYVILTFSNYMFFWFADEMLRHIHLAKSVIPWEFSVTTHISHQKYFSKGLVGGLHSGIKVRYLFISLYVNIATTQKISNSLGQDVRCYMLPRRSTLVDPNSTLFSIN